MNELIHIALFQVGQKVTVLHPTPSRVGIFVSIRKDRHHYYKLCCINFGGRKEWVATKSVRAA